MINFIKNRKILVISIIIVLVGALILFTGGGEENIYDTVEAERMNITQLVSVIGTVYPSDTVDLAFDRSGRVGGIYYDIGDDVLRGYAIARLENGSLTSELNQAEATLEGEVSKLAELNRGPTSYEINTKESEVNETRQQLENAYDSVDTVGQEAYADAYDALKNKAEPLFDGSRENYNFDLTFNVCNSQDKSNAESERLKIEFLLDQWKEEKKISDDATKEELIIYLNMTQSRLNDFNDFFSIVNNALESVCESDESLAAEYRAAISTAKNNVLAALSEVSSLKQDISLKEATLNKKEKELQQLIAGASQEEIQTQQSAVNKAKAAVENIKAQIEKGVIRSPFNGVITQIDIEEGETVTTGNSVVSVISNAGFEIETNIPEVDITKVKVGDTATITLDAYDSNQEFQAAVTQINPAETVIDGVTTYKITLEFSEEYEGIKSGMTANVDIKTGEKENVIAVPKRSVIESNGRSYVRVLQEDNTIKEVDVETGLLGTSGNVEIIEGLEGSEKVVTFVRE